jgi:arginyl-tRNA synthetase
MVAPHPETSRAGDRPGSAARCDNLARVTPADLAAAVRSAVSSAVADGDLDVPVPDEVRIERPRSKEHGDWATPVALQLARPAGRPPREVAEILLKRLREVPGIADAAVAGPGFLNVHLEQAALGDVARTVVQAGADYGRNDRLAGQRLNLEFVSANPTGPVHVGAVRWAAFGDALGRVLTACAAEVSREYYSNDAGSQLDRFAESLAAVARGESPPAGGYTGEYLHDIAARVLADHPGLLERDPESARDVFRSDGVTLMLHEIQQSLARFGVVFDVYFRERQLHETGEIRAAVDRLRAAGHVYDDEGAVWLRTTDFGDDRDRVLVRSNGETTYFAADVAYYVDKRRRGFDRAIVVLGADHHGYLGRLRAAVRCLGEDPDAHLELLVGQLVHLVRGAEAVKLSKRAGTVVTLDDLVDAVGVDAARYSLARAPIDSPLELDLDLLTRQVAENPVFYVQYAHARICSLLARAGQAGIDRRADFDGALLGGEREGDLLAALAEFPRVVAGAAELREPHRVARYLEELAGTYHRFYESCRVLPLGDEPVTAQHLARVWLCDATRIVLGNGLQLLGVAAPERM